MPKVIKTEEDLNITLKRIDELMNAKPGTPEFDELELLSTLVEIYEDKNYPIGTPDAVSAIKFRMEQLGLNQQDLVPFLGSKSKVSEVLNKKRKLTLPMIRALSKGLGIPSDILLESRDLTIDDNLFHELPLDEMKKKGWFPDSLELSAKDIINDFIRNAGGIEAANCCLFRQSASARQNVKNDNHNLTAWCLKVLETANRKTLPNRYIEGTVNGKFLREVAKLSYFDNGPVLAKEYLGKHGIHLVILPHLSKTYLDGAMIFRPNKDPIIGLTLRYDRLDNFWFCLLHELAHLSKHTNKNVETLIIDDLDLRRYELDDIKENEADVLAQDSLIPDESWRQLEVSKNSVPSLNQIRDLSNKLKISPAIVAGRIRYETNNYKKFSNLIGRGNVRKQFKMSSCRG